MILFKTKDEALEPTNYTAYKCLLLVINLRKVIN